MNFRCPNCGIAVDMAGSGPQDDTVSVDEVECPSCHSRFSLSEEQTRTVVPESGLKIGHFEVQSLLGEGGFGVVYKAWDAELDRTVAIKLPQGKHRHSGSNQFLREAKAAAAIDHPNVVSVYEVGIEDNDYYIVSQFINGLTLSEYHRSAPLTHEQIVGVLIKVLRAIDHFHERGIVHRDLKPGNILVDADLEPFVTDFGLARRDVAPGVTVTEDGRILGTIRYMAPEQAKGQLSAVDRQTDVYGMGVVLFELLTGRTPFKSQSNHTLLFNIIHQDAPRLRKIDSDIPAELATICEKAISKQKADRYSTAAAFADDLQRFADGRPILAKPVGPVQTAIKWAKRNRRLSAALGGVLALSVLSLILWLRSGTPEVVTELVPELIPEGSVRVQVHTTPPATEIVYEQIDAATRMPMAEGIRKTCRDGDTVWLLPGLYRVSARDADGRFHEVWRTVPQKGSESSSESRYLHTDFTFRGRVYVLPSIRLFHRDDLLDPFISIPGGSFQMGYQTKATNDAGIHTHPVDAFQVCPDEVCWSRFRTVMNVKAHGRNGTTYLQLLTQFFGDRSEEPGNMPVTGYPPDVAILYAELAGGRLPFNFEYEYLLTTYASTRLPDWPQPAGAVEPRAVDAETEDLTTDGVRNLLTSVGEFTDNTVMTYLICFPHYFPKEIVAEYGKTGLIPQVRAQFIGSHEVRAIPFQKRDQGQATRLFDPRVRIRAEDLPATEEAATILDDVGWRLYRSGSF
ncbi:MAG: bifunctional serine/threonine-protein kinase/formylglycine-generating enzyme family protein [Planctomycetaceae bacterium]|nr:bifunctional serine/threonine-protein kinase/formylglycine-generating enzyme family protein [Planctomycetaceae bacterium]